MLSSQTDSVIVSGPLSFLVRQRTEAAKSEQAASLPEKDKGTSLDSSSGGFAARSAYCTNQSGSADYALSQFLDLFQCNAEFHEYSALISEDQKEAALDKLIVQLSAIPANDSSFSALCHLYSALSINLALKTEINTNGIDAVINAVKTPEFLNVQGSQAALRYHLICKDVSEHLKPWLHGKEYADINIYSALTHIRIGSFYERMHGNMDYNYIDKPGSDAVINYNSAAALLGHVSEYFSEDYTLQNRYIIFRYALKSFTMAAYKGSISEEQRERSGGLVQNITDQAVSYFNSAFPDLSTVAKASDLISDLSQLAQAAYLCGKNQQFYKWCEKIELLLSAEGQSQAPEQLPQQLLQSAELILLLRDAVKYSEQKHPSEVLSSYLKIYRYIHNCSEVSNAARFFAALLPDNIGRFDISDLKHMPLEHVEFAGAYAALQYGDHRNAQACFNHGILQYTQHLSRDRLRPGEDAVCRAICRGIKNLIKYCDNPQYVLNADGRIRESWWKTLTLLIEIKSAYKKNNLNQLADNISGLQNELFKFLGNYLSSDSKSDILRLNQLFRSTAIGKSA